MSRFERLLLGASSVAVGISGCGYGWMKYFLRPDDPYAVVNHPLQPIFLKIHVLTSPLLVFALGLVFSSHVLQRFQAGLPGGRRSGLVTWAAVVPMIASGYLIQTLTGKLAVAILVVLHLVAGGLYLIGFLAHRVTAQNGRREGSPSLLPLQPAEDQEALAAAPARPSSGAMDRSASSTNAI